MRGFSRCDMFAGHDSGGKVLSGMIKRFFKPQHKPYIADLYIFRETFPLLRHTSKKYT
jgi:hypothetical protein